jgi:CrcB protein
MTPTKNMEGRVSRHAFSFLLVFIGGGLGSIMRHAANQAGAALLGRDFSYSTMFVNITGSLAIGLIAGWFALRGAGGQMLPLFLTTGILGGFTTFSAFSLDTALLWERGQAVRAAVYVLGSLIPAVVAVFLGLALMRTILR